MTKQDVHIALKTTMDKNEMAISFGGCPAFLPQELDLFLDQATIEIVNNKFTGTNVRNEAFEQSDKRISDLQNLIVTDTGLTFTTTTPVNKNSFILEDFSTGLDDNTRLFFVSGSLLLTDQIIDPSTDVAYDSRRQNVHLISHQEANRFKVTDNNVPWIPEPVAVLENNNLIIYVDPLKYHYNVYTCTLDVTYVKYPTKFSSIVDYSTQITDFNDDVLFEIINRAAIIGLENIESQRTATKVQLNQLSE